MKTSELKATIRITAGKGPARRLRQQGLIPAVYYGHAAETLHLTIATADLLGLLRHREENLFIKLNIQDSGKPVEKLCMIKEFQREPASGKLIHADFYAISMKEKILVDVPIHLTGTPVGVGDGGELQWLKRDVKISCLPGDMPEHIDLDVTDLAIGDAIKVANLVLGKGIVMVDHGDVAIAAVTATREATAKEAETTTAGETSEGDKAAPAE